MALKVHHIKVALVRHNKTGRQIASKVGLSPTAFSRLMHGHRRAGPKLLAAIEAAINEPTQPQDDETAGANETPPAV
jgi:transcriptional regulator with XRE-family HTH domain